MMGDWGRRKTTILRARVGHGELLSPSARVGRRNARRFLLARLCIAYDGKVPPRCGGGLDAVALGLLLHALRGGLEHLAGERDRLVRSFKQALSCCTVEARVS